MTLTQLAPRRKHTHTKARGLLVLGPNVQLDASSGHRRVSSHTHTRKNVFIITRGAACGRRTEVRPFGSATGPDRYRKRVEKGPRGRGRMGGGTTATHADGSDRVQHPHVLGFFRSSRGSPGLCDSRSPPQTQRLVTLTCWRRFQDAAGRLRWIKRSPFCVFQSFTGSMSVLQRSEATVLLTLVSGSVPGSCRNRLDLGCV